METHHNGKRDAPSGTAKTILDRHRGGGTAPTTAFTAAKVTHRVNPAKSASTPAVRAVSRANTRCCSADDHEEPRLTHRAETGACSPPARSTRRHGSPGGNAGRYEFSEVISE